jgi:hypothetical protein
VTQLANITNFVRLRDAHLITSGNTIDHGNVAKADQPAAIAAVVSKFSLPAFWPAESDLLGVFQSSSIIKIQRAHVMLLSESL